MALSLPPSARHFSKYPAVISSQPATAPDEGWLAAGRLGSQALCHTLPNVPRRIEMGTYIRRHDGRHSHN